MVMEGHFQIILFEPLREKLVNFFNGFAERNAIDKYGQFESRNARESWPGKYWDLVK